MSDEDDKRDPLLRSAIDDAIEEHEHAKKRQKVTKSVRFSEANEVHEIPGSDEQVRGHSYGVYQPLARRRNLCISPEHVEAEASHRAPPGRRSTRQQRQHARRGR